MHNVQVTPIIGLPQFNGWSQVTTNAQGNVVCAFSIAGLNAGNIGRDVVETLNAVSPTSAADVHQLFEQIIADVTQKGCEFECSVGVIGDGTAVFATYNGHILLKRQEKVGTLIRSEAHLTIIQGRSDVDDIYVLTTGHAASFVGEIQQKLIQGYDIDTIITSVVPALHSLADSSLSSMGFVLVETATSFSQNIPPIELPATDSTVASEPVLPTSSLPTYTKERFIPTPPVIPPTEISQLPTDVAELEGPVDSAMPKTAQPLPFHATAKPSFKRPSLSLASLSKLRPHVRSAVSRLKNTTARWHWPPQPGEIYVTQGSRKKLLTILIPVVLVVLAIVVGVTIWRRRISQQVTAAQTAMSPIVEQLSAAEATVPQDPIQARAEMETAIQDLQVLQGQFEKQPAAQKIIKDELTQAQTVYQQFSGREELQALNIFYDFRLVASDFVVNRADAYEQQGLFMDDGKKQIINLDLGSKQVKTLPTIPADQPVDLTLVNNTAVVLGNGIRSLTLPVSSDSQYQTIKDQGDSNQDGKLVGYFNQYVYIFNPAKRNIFRYAPESKDSTTYSDPIGWVKPGNSVPYDTVNSWSIDGDIWLGTKDGKIVKLTSGAVADFTIQGLNDEFNSPLIVYTKDNVDNLYVLEPANQRLVILKKTGEFVREVKSPSLATTTALIVSQSLGKALAISGSLVFEISL